MGRDDTVPQTSVLDKLDKVIAGQTEMTTAQATMLLRLEALEKRVEELYMTVRGHNGTPGMVTEMAVIKTTLSQALAEREKDCNCKDDDDDDDKKDGGEKRSSTEEKVMDKLAWPLATTFLFWVLYDILPKVLVLIQNHDGTVPIK